MIRKGRPFGFCHKIQGFKSEQVWHGKQRTVFKYCKALKSRISLKTPNVMLAHNTHPILCQLVSVLSVLWFCLSGCLGSSLGQKPLKPLTPPFPATSLSATFLLKRYCYRDLMFCQVFNIEINHILFWQEVKCFLVP